MDKVDPELVKMINELAGVTKRLNDYINHHQQPTNAIPLFHSIYDIFDRELIIDNVEIHLDNPYGFQSGLSLLYTLAYPNNANVLDHMHRIVDILSSVSMRTHCISMPFLEAFHWIIDHDNDDIIIKIVDSRRSAVNAKPLILHKGECILILSDYVPSPLFWFPACPYIRFVIAKEEHVEILEQQLKRVQGECKDAEDQQKQNVISDITGGIGNISHT